VVVVRREREKVIDWQRKASILSRFSLSLLSSNHSRIRAIFLEPLGEAVCRSFVAKLEMVGRRATCVVVSMICEEGKLDPHLFLDGGIIRKNPLNPHKFMEFVLEIKLLNSLSIAKPLPFGLIL
jgi:hypothetical protein